MNDTPTPRSKIILDHIKIYVEADNAAQSYAHYEEVNREIESMERELTAAREEIDMMGIRYAAAEMHHANNMQEVTEQREDFKKELEIANLRLKGKHHPDDNGIIADGEIDIKALIESNDTLSKDRERWRKIAIYNGLQSDRLAEELTAAREASTQWEAEAWRSDELLEQRDNELTAAREELTAVTEQLAEMTLRWELTNDSLFDKRALADRLAEALRKIQRVGLVAVDAFDELDRIDEIVDEALAAVKGGGR